MVEWQDSGLPITKQAEQLGFNRPSLYYKPVEPSAEEGAIKHQFDEVYKNIHF